MALGALRMALEFALLLSHAQVGTGTTFWRNESIYGPTKNACYRRVPGTKIPKLLDDHAMVFAHKKLPCGQRAIVCNLRTSLCVRAVKTDWGPAVATIDMSKAVAKKLKSNGKELFLVIPVDF